MKIKHLAGSVVIAALSVGTAFAQVKVGVISSSTGPIAMVGIPQKNTVALMPTKAGGQTIEYIALDDGSDPTASVVAVKKLISEHKVDAIVGPSGSPNAMGVIQFVAEAGVPLLAPVGTAAVVLPMDDKKKWVFKTPQNDLQMATAIIEHMLAKSVKKVAFIGFANAYGDGWYEQFKKLADARGIEIVANERFNPADTSVTGQALKLISAKPDAVFIAGSGTPAALPQKALRERGYKGVVYQTHGVANNDFLRICGKDCEGTLLPVGPVQMARQLPDSNPVKKSALAYVEKYEAANGKGSVSSFGAYAWDAGVLLNASVPAALKKAKPGTPEFRAALRDGLEAVKEVAGATGIYSMSASDHLGLDQRSRVMIEIRNGEWSLLK